MYMTNPMRVPSDCRDGAPDEHDLRVVLIQEHYVAKTSVWEGPPRPDYMAARADLLDHLA
jgi:hypothetical protein